MRDWDFLDSQGLGNARNMDVVGSPVCPGGRPRFLEEDPDTVSFAKCPHNFRDTKFLLKEVAGGVHPQQREGRTWSWTWWPFLTKDVGPDEVGPFQPQPCCDSM